MSNSSSGDKSGSGPSAGAVGSAGPEEWPATRVDIRSRQELDEWQPTRVLVDDRVAGEARQADRPQPNGARPPPASFEAARPRGTRESPDAWAATRAHTTLATQILPDENDYLASVKDEIGRQIGGNERELFVSCAPAEALQQQFEHLQPEFIAVHDLATASSRKLLAGIAAASGRSVQKLVIRRWASSWSASCRATPSPPRSSRCTKTSWPAPGRTATCCCCPSPRRARS
jgi:hypothetical protein